MDGDLSAGGDECAAAFEGIDPAGVGPGAGAFGEEEELAAVAEGVRGIADHAGGGAVGDVAGEACAAAEEGVAEDGFFHHADGLGEAGDDEDGVPEGSVVGGDDDGVVELGEGIEGGEVGADEAGEAEVADELAEEDLHEATAEADAEGFWEDEVEGAADEGDEESADAPVEDAAGHGAEVPRQADPRADAGGVRMGTCDLLGIGVGQRGRQVVFFGG